MATQLMLIAAVWIVTLVGNQANQVEAGFYGYSRLTLFENANGEGDAYFLRVGSECVDLPEGIRRWASSIDTHGTCTMVCRYPYCRKCVRMYPGSPGHQDLRDVDYNDQIVSVRACEDQEFFF